MTPPLDEPFLDTDLCIVGSGPAGLSVAAQFLGSGVKVLVLESGDWEPCPAAQALNSGATVGDPYAAPDQTRLRRVGGTLHLWNTFVRSERVARYVPLDAIDFEE